MSKVIEVPNYGQVEFPDDMSDEAIVSAIKKNALGYKEPTQQTSLTESVKNVAGGLVRGAGSIGATVLKPFDMVDSATKSHPILNEVWKASSPLAAISGLTNTDNRRTGMDNGLTDMGADPNSLLFKGGKIVGEVAGTAGAGGVIGNSAGRVLPALGNAISSGGMTLGTTGGNTLVNGAIRLAGGAINGAAQAGLANPNDALAGGVIGGAIPVAAVGARILGKTPSFVAKHGLGMTTGAGSEAVSQAFQAGQQGKTAFLDNMRGNTSFEDVVDQAKQGLSNMRADRASSYRSGMVDIKNDKSILDFTPIQKAVDEIQSMGSFKGVQINKNASGVVNDIADTVNQWKALDPAEYHTPEGFDALKQAIGDIRDSTPFGTPARKAADTIYNAVKGQITDQAPTYSKVMKDYSEASKTLTELEKSLSLGNKTQADTAVRKLQSVMRNNAQTNYGNRLDMVNKLQTKGNVDLMPSLAGQSMNSWMPRGMIGDIEKGGAMYAAWKSPLQAAKMAAFAPLASPRVVGEAAYKAGSLKGLLDDSLNSVIDNNKLLNGGSGLLTSSARYLPLAILSSQTMKQ